MKIVAVWGASGAGKTTLALAAAAELARRKRDVLVLGADNGAPCLPVYLPHSSLSPAASIGPALEHPASEASLKDRLHKHPRSDRIYFAGYVSGEIPAVAYKIPQRSCVESLFQVLQGSPFSYCLVDCATSPVLDPLTLYVLEAAQSVLRVVSPDVKSWEWQRSQVAWLANNDAFSIQDHLKLCNPVLPADPLAEAASLFGPFDAVLPYAASVAQRMAAGELLSGFHDRDGLAFGARMEDLIDLLEVSGHAS